MAIDEFDGVKVDERNDTKYDIGYNDGIDFAVSRLSVLPPAQPKNECEYWDSESSFCTLYRPSAQPETRIFVELVVEYPDPELCTYKEYKGKPYYSIKYIENGEAYVGYGTYKPEVLSRYLREYFMPSAQPERRKGKWRKGICECGYDWAKDAPISSVPNFCPNCGADMREVNANEAN